MITTVIQVVAFIAFIAGALIISTLIAIAILGILDKGFDLVSRLIRLPSSPTSNPMENIRDRSNYGTNQSEVPIHPQITFQKIAYNLKARLGTEILQRAICKRGSPCQHGDTQEHNKEYSRYPKRFIPVKHLETIVNWLRRCVNHSGKEPSRELTCFC